MKKILIKADNIEQVRRYVDSVNPGFRNSYQGDVYLICKYPGDWENNIRNPRDVTSTLMDKGVLGFHILAEIKTGNVYDFKSLQKWFDRTLAKIQAEFPEDLFRRCLEDLETWGMMVTTEIGQYKITRLGRVSADLYYLPQDIYHWSVAFGRVAEHDLWDNDVAIAYSLGSVPSWQIGYIPKDAEDRTRRFTEAVLKLPGFDKAWRSSIAADAYDLIVGHDIHMSMRNVQFDSPRICQALLWIDRVKGWKNTKFWSGLQLRVKYGAPADLAELCQIPGIGITRAKKLKEANIKSLDAILNEDNFRKVEFALGKVLARKAINFIKTEKRANRHEGEEE